MNLELTAKCNLRCVYCSKSFSEAEDKRVLEMPEEWIASSIGTLWRRGLWFVITSGIGETTLRRGWERICRSLHERGLTLSIISNFARPLSDKSVATLVRYKSIQVSVDTADTELFARIRRGGQLEVLLRNIDRVRSFARSSGVRAPTFRFDVVVTDKTVIGLPDLVRLGLRHGVSDFYFANLLKGPDTKGPFNVYNADMLPRAELTRAADALEEACDLARSAGCVVECHPGLRESLRQSSRGHSATVKLSWGAARVRTGMTRNCAEPWKYVFLYADGQVRPCCAYDVAVGDLRTQTLEEVLNGPPIRELRGKLLSGDLSGTLCECCSMRPEIPTREFRKRIGGLRILWSIRRRTLNLLHH